MARLNQTFYPGQYPNSADIAFEPGPAGTYEVQIPATDLKTTKNLKGQYIWMELTIIRNPEYQDRKIFANITISNENQKAVDIGRAQLGDLLEITGLATFSDTDELKNRILKVKVKIQDGTPEYPNKQNRVTAYLYPDGHAPGKGPLPTGEAPVSAAAPSAPKASPKRPF